MLDEGQATERLRQLEAELKGPRGRPLDYLPVQAHVQELPFTRLTWRQFEQLCLAVISKESDLVDEPHLYGGQGDEQHGIDIIANRRTGPNGAVERWVYQCKNHEYFPLSKLKEAIEKLDFEADKYVIITADEAKASHRDVILKYDDLSLWDGLDLSRKLKPEPDIVADFFLPVWVEIFCEHAAAAEWRRRTQGSRYAVRGTVYDANGHAALGVSVQVITEAESPAGTTGPDGRFVVALQQQATQVHYIASHVVMNERYSDVKSFEWVEAVAGTGELHLELDWNLGGKVTWFGSKEPVPDAEVAVTLHGHRIRNVLARSGSFQTTLPSTREVMRLKVDVPGATGPFEMDLSTAEPSLVLSVARACLGRAREVAVVQWICDDCEIQFGLVRGSPAALGGADAPVPDFMMGRYPVTCAQYAFYLQHNPAVDPPDGWTRRSPPATKEMHPVTGVTWEQTNAYCEWLTARTGIVHRLPSGAEWARAAAGITGHPYPWGAATEDFGNRCNSAEDNINQTTRVDRYPRGRSEFGMWDMVGNVWECISDMPLGAAQGGVNSGLCFACGGSYMDPRGEANCSSTAAFLLARGHPQLGFRVLREHNGGA